MGTRRMRALYACDAYYATLAERFIAAQPQGSKTWPDGTTTPTTTPGLTLVITDVVGTEDGDVRCIEVYRDERVVVTLMYDHDTRELVRTL